LHLNESGTDFCHLQAALEGIHTQVPFVERRARANGHKRDPAVELLEVIEELNEREAELNAAVGIAKMLLEKMMTAQESVRGAAEQFEEAECKVKELERELKAERQSNEASVIEKRSLGGTMEALEQHVAELTLENKDLQKKVAAYKAKTKGLTEAHKEQLAQEIETIALEKEACQSELESNNYTERLISLEKQLDEGRAAQSKLEGTLHLTEDQHAKTKAKLLKAQDKARHLDDELGLKQSQEEELQGQVQDLEHRLTLLKLENDRPKE
jgi:chromosome segregation ATPase